MGGPPNVYRQMFQGITPKGPKYLYGTKYGFCSSDFPYGLGKYTPYGHLGPFGYLGIHGSPKCPRTQYLGTWGFGTSNCSTGSGKVHEC